MSQEVGGEFQRWFIKAEEDLNLVLKLLKDEDANQFTSSIGFHCQQAIEKFLKAFLIYNQKEFKRTHDLNLLRNLCSEIDSDFAILEFGELIEFAVDYRYPDDSYIPELEEIITYKELILNIKMMIETKIINLEK
jgi:HEPN domain-containing protein